MINNFKEFLNDNTYLKDLSERIMKFVDKYAGISPNWDEEDPDGDNKYNSPDAPMMVTAAEMFAQGKIPSRCWSEWESGGYKPYTSKEGRLEHDALMTEINKLINKK